MKYSIFLVLLFTCVSSFYSQSLVEGTDQLQHVYEVIHHKGKLFVATAYGLKYSYDDGKTYSKAPLPNYKFNCLAATSEYIITGASGDYSLPADLFYSSDGGTTWSSIIGDLPKSGISKLHINNNIIYAINGNKLYRSTNFGTNWIISNNGLNSSYLTCINSKDSLFVLGSENGVFISKDYGLTWKLSNAGLYNNGVYEKINDIAFLEDSILISSNFVYKSTNNGTNWTRISSAYAQWTNFNLLVYNNEIYSNQGNFHGILKYTGDPENWQPISYLPITYMYSYGSKIYLGTRHAGVMCTEDVFSSFSGVSTGALTMMDITFLSKIDQYVFAGNTTGKVYRSDNDGISWVQQYLSGVIKGVTKNGEKLFAVAENGDLFSSLNMGQLWEQVLTNIKVNNPVAISSLGQDLFIGSSNNGIYKSTDMGNTWLNFSAGIENQKIINMIVINGVLYVGTETGVYILQNNGVIFSKIDQIGNGKIYFIKAEGNNIIINSNMRIWTSINGGDVWQKLETGYYWWDAFYDGYYDGQNIILLCDDNYNYDGFLHVSVDNGLNFDKFRYGISSTGLKNLVKINNSLVYSTTWNGVWRLPLNFYVGVKEVKTDILPTNVNLSQNYPNPFNPSTTIEFTIPQNDHVILKVYDILGKEVATLLNEELTVGGYKINWVPEKLASGIYFAVMQVGKFNKTIKMNYLK